MYKKSRVIENATAGLSERSIMTYNSAVHSYEKFHKTSIEKLVEEALNEQTERIPEHQLSLYDRLLDYRNYLMEGNIGGTVSKYFQIIKTIYKRNRVTIPYLPPLNIKSVKRNPYISFNDILTKEEIRNAISIANPQVQIRMMAMATGGYSNEETKNFTNRQFIEDLYPYHQEDDPVEALHKLSKMDNVIWETKLIRQKTKKPYYGFVNPETTQAIARLKLKEDFDLDKPLFKYNKIYFARLLKEINDTLQLGTAGGYSKLSAHALRRFNATYLKGLDLTAEESMRLSDIDELQGRGKTNTQDAYIKTNPLKQKLLYAKYMNNVSLYNQYTYHIGEDDIIVERIKEDTLKKENKKLKQTIINITNSNDGLKQYIKNVGEDNFELQLNRLLREL